MTQQAPTQAVLACSQCARTFAQSDLVQIAGNLVCGECKPAYLSLVMAGSAGLSRWHYGGFWIRVLARLIDAAAMWLVAAFIGTAFFGTFGAQFMPSVMRSASGVVRVGYQLALYGIAFLYEIIFLRYWGATLGKMAVGIKVVRTDGASLTWGIAIGRYFMYIVSGIILLIGDIMAGFDKEKRALHDRVCDTRVVYKRSLARA